MQTEQADKFDREHLNKAEGVQKPATLGRRRKRRPPPDGRPAIETKDVRP